MQRNAKTICLFGLTSLAFWLWNCDSRHSLKNYQDPYLDSFRGSGVRYRISYNVNYPEFSDTAVFDKSGSLIQFLSQGLEERKAYDSLRFLSKLWQRSDVLYNLRYKYSWSENGLLVEECRELADWDWQRPANERDRLFRAVFFEIDREGNITSETDTVEHTKILYKYDEAHRLVQKRECSLDSNECLQWWDYDYGERSKLRKISLSDEKQRLLVHY